MKLLDIPLDLMIHSKNPITSAIKGLIMSHKLINNSDKYDDRSFIEKVKNNIYFDYRERYADKDSYPFTYGSIHQLFNLLTSFTNYCLNSLDVIENELFQTTCLVITSPLFFASYLTAMTLSGIGEILQTALNLANAISMIAGIIAGVIPSLAIKLINAFDDSGDIEYSQNIFNRTISWTPPPSREHLSHTQNNDNTENEEELEGRTMRYSRY